MPPCPPPTRLPPSRPARPARPAPARYAGYRSFEYLTPGTDFRAFELATDLDRVEPYVVEVSEAEEERAQRLLADNIAISLHDHTEINPVDPAETEAWIRETRIATGFAGLARSGFSAVFENFEDGVATITSKSGWKWTDVIHDIGMRYSDWAHQDFVVRAERVADIRAAHAIGPDRDRRGAWRPRRRSRTSSTGSTSCTGSASGCSASSYSEATRWGRAAGRRSTAG